MSRARSVRAWGPSTGPTACALAGRRCSLWGWRKGVPGGGVPSTIVRGAWGQALSLSRLPAHCWVGCRGSLGVCGVCGVCAVRVVVPGAALPLVLRCSPLRCLVRCCARRVPAVSPPLCAPLARSLATPCSFRGCVALYPFLYPSPWYALFPCLRFVVCLCLFPCRPGLPPLNLRRERRGRKRACGGGGFVATRHLELAGTSCVCNRLARRFIAPLAPVLSPPPFGRYLYSLPVPRARRDMQHTCFFPHYLNVS